MSKPRRKIALVAFLDILGFKSKIQTMETDNDFENVYNELELVQSEFAKKSDKLDNKYRRSIGKKVLVFSDCIVISLNLTSQFARQFGNFDPFLAELHYFGLCQMTCACNGVFLRGGITIGDWFFSNDMLISSALLEAYEIERNIAQFPIISISKNAVNFFRNHPERQNYSHEIDPVNFLFRKYRTETGQYHHFLDYLQIGFDGSADWYTEEDRQRYLSEKNNDKKMRILDRSYSENQKFYLLGHKDALVRAMISNRDERIKDKFLFLLKYHNNFVRKFGSFYSDAKISKKEVT